MTKIEFVFDNLTKNVLSKIWPKSKFFEILTKIEIFRKFDQNRNCSKFSRNSLKILSKLLILGNFRKIELKSKSKFFENLTKIDILRNFRNFQKHRKCSKFLNKIEIFGKFYQNRNFWKFSNISKTLMNFDRNQNFSVFDQNFNFSKIWQKSKFFEIFE